MYKNTLNITHQVDIFSSSEESKTHTRAPEEFTSHDWKVSLGSICKCLQNITSLHDAQAVISGLQPRFGDILPCR